MSDQQPKEPIEGENGSVKETEIKPPVQERIEEYERARTSSEASNPDAAQLRKRTNRPTVQDVSVKEPKDPKDPKREETPAPISTSSDGEPASTAPKAEKASGAKSPPKNPKDASWTEKVIGGGVLVLVLIALLFYLFQNPTRDGELVYNP